MLSEASKEAIFSSAEYNALDQLWWITEKPDKYGFPNLWAKSYQKRIELFCMIIKWLLSEGKMRLAKRGAFLEGTPQEQTDLFRESFPKTAEEMEEKEGYWWYLDECPGGAVWYTDVDDNGFQTSPTGDGRFYFWT